MTNHFIDPRDGQSYKTIRLKDEKIWLAENLNFKIEGSMCYEDKEKYGEQYGRLYTWEAAKAACPPGWHLPSDEEWWQMTSHYGKAYSSAKNTIGEGVGEAAYLALIEGGDSGFNAQFAGYRSTFDEFYGIGDFAYYWSGTERNKEEAWRYSFRKTYRHLYHYSSPKSWLFSCRCIRD